MSRALSYREDSVPPNNTATGAIFVACRVAERYKNRLPTWQELVESYGMTRATAYRWIRAMRDARGLP